MRQKEEGRALSRKQAKQKQKKATKTKTETKSNQAFRLSQCQASIYANATPNEYPKKLSEKIAHSLCTICH